jgi:hypothetical protein
MKKDEFGRHDRTRCIFWDHTGRGAGLSMSIERGKRGLGRRSLRHCLGLSPSSPDPGRNKIQTASHSLPAHDGLSPNGAPVRPTVLQLLLLFFG